MMFILSLLEPDCLGMSNFLLSRMPTRLELLVEKRDPHMMAWPS